MSGVRVPAPLLFSAFSFLGAKRSHGTDARRAPSWKQGCRPPETEKPFFCAAPGVRASSTCLAIPFLGAAWLPRGRHNGVCLLHWRGLHLETKTRACVNDSSGCIIDGLSGAPRMNRRSVAGRFEYVTVHGPAGDWSIFRPKDSIPEKKRKPKTWTCPLSGRRGQSPVNGYSKPNVQARAPVHGRPERP